MEHWISHTKLEYVSSPKYFEHGDILFAITGESVEDIAKSIAYIGHEKCLAGGDIVVMKHKQNPKYLSYVLSTYNARLQKSKGKAEELIMEEKLNEEAAKRYILTSLRKEYASENGTDLNEILPKMSPLNPQYHTKKQSVFEKISTFVEKFKGVGGVI